MKTAFLFIFFVTLTMQFGQEHFSRLFQKELNSEILGDSTLSSRADSSLATAAKMHPDLLYWCLLNLNGELTDEKYQQIYNKYAGLRNDWIQSEIDVIQNSEREALLKKACVLKLNAKVVPNGEFHPIEYKADQNKSNYLFYKYILKNKALFFVPETDYHFLFEKQLALIFKKTLRILNLKSKKAEFPEANFDYIVNNYFVLQNPAFKSKYYPVNAWLADAIEQTDEYKNMKAKIELAKPPFENYGHPFAFVFGVSPVQPLDAAGISEMSNLAPEVPISSSISLSPGLHIGLSYFKWRQKEKAIFRYFLVSTYLKYFPGIEFNSLKDPDQTFVQIAQANEIESGILGYSITKSNIKLNSIITLGTSISSPLYYPARNLSLGIYAGYEAQLMTGKEEIYIRRQKKINQWSFEYETLGGEYKIKKINHLLSGGITLRYNFSRFTINGNIGWPFSMFWVEYIL